MGKKDASLSIWGIDKYKTEVMIEEEKKKKKKKKKKSVYGNVVVR